MSSNLNFSLQCVEVLTGGSKRFSICKMLISQQLFYCLPWNFNLYKGLDVKGNVIHLEVYIWVANHPDNCLGGAGPFCISSVQSLIWKDRNFYSSLGLCIFLLFRWTGGETFDGKAVEKPFILQVIYIPLRQLKHSSVKSAPTLVDLMPVLVQPPAI